jgi:hypothetical protein
MRTAGSTCKFWVNPVNFTFLGPPDFGLQDLWLSESHPRRAPLSLQGRGVRGQLGLELMQPRRCLAAWEKQVLSARGFKWVS